MSQIVASTATKVDTLLTAVKGLEALADTLKADVDALIAGGSLSAEDTATLQGISDKADAALAEVAAKIAADTPAAPAPPAPPA